MTSLIQTLTSGASVPSRRAFMGRTGTLSAVAVALLAGKDAMAQGMAGDTSKDVSILNVALGLEHEAINAYQLGAGSGLLQKPVLDVAVRFQADHKAHRDALIATIQKLGGTPVMEKKLDGLLGMVSQFYEGGANGDESLMNKDPEFVKQRWKTVRDRFVIRQ